MFTNRNCKTQTSHILQSMASHFTIYFINQISDFIYQISYIINKISDIVYQISYINKISYMTRYLICYIYMLYKISDMLYKISIGI